MFSKLMSMCREYAGRLDVRLTTYYTVLLLGLSLLVCLFCYFRLQHLLVKQVDKILIDETRELMSDITEAADVAAGCRVFEQDIAHRKYYQIEFRVVDSSGTVVYETAQAPRLSLSAPASGFATIRIEGRRSRYRVYHRPMTVLARDLQVFVATTMRHDYELLERFAENVLWGLPFILVLSIACGMISARKPCRIMRDIATIAGGITSENLHERLPVPTSRDEVRTLTETINAMIERLEQSFSHLRQFTADVSHELRNPLFALRGNLEVALAHQRDPDEYRETISDCLEKIDFLIKMVNDMFLVSRFETGKIHLDAQVVNICDIVQDIVDFYAPMAQERSITLRFDRCDMAVILADKTRLLQLLNNLLDNALKFTPDGGTVQLSVHRHRSDIVLSITDTGIGIPEQDLPHVFDRFYQVDSARTGERHGAGLGLQICKRIAEAHGWSIGVKRNEGPGVTFFVTIPVRQ
ncbi:MAG: ATP-binding protein [Desulfobacterota bacterium]|nr:ATP-binding protein [Thermodesulfobacteriota bacterium]